MKLLKPKIIYTATIALVFAGIGLFSASNASAKSINPNDIDNRSYVIGQHLFTRDINQDAGYNGYITTQMIMLAAKTIPNNTMDDMNVYYKKTDGTWVDGLTNQTILNMPSSFEIEYKNLDLYIAKTEYTVEIYNGGYIHAESGYTTVSYEFELQNIGDFKIDEETMGVDGFEQLILAEDAEDWIYTLGDPSEDCQIIIDGVRYCHIAGRAGNASDVIALFPAGQTYHLVTRAYKTVGDRTIYSEPSASIIDVPNYYKVDILTSSYPTVGVGGISQFVQAGQTIEESFKQEIGENPTKYGYNYGGLYVARNCTAEEKTQIGLDVSANNVVCVSDTSFNLNTPINSDLQLVLKWIPHTYSVKVKPTDAVGAIMGTATVYDEDSILTDSYAIYLEGTDTQLFDSQNPSIALGELAGITKVKLVITHNAGTFTTTASLTQIPYSN